jgi:hypothetical protein
MSISKIVKLNKTKQLIDLNEDKTNFELEFNVQSMDNKPFYIVVATQEDLDSGNELEYKNVENGIISGNITADKDFYKNYYLVLKSNEENECNININIKEIPPNQEFKNMLLQKQKQQQQIQEQEHIEMYNKEQQKIGKNDNTNDINNKWKYITILVGLLIGGALIYYFFFRNNIKPDIDAGNISNSQPPIEIMDNILYNDNTVLCNVASSMGGNSNLLAKINDLEI